VNKYIRVTIRKQELEQINTGGTKKISDEENFRKILKVGHFYLGFS